MLEAMEERQITIDGLTHPLSQFFTVFATQNPIEFEGTYPLPEAQLDRFLLKIKVGYPAAEQEITILQHHHEGFDAHNLGAANIVALSSERAGPGARGNSEASKLRQRCSATSWKSSAVHAAGRRLHWAPVLGRPSA